MPYWLLVSECVLVTVNLSHALPRGETGVGGLGIWFSLRPLVVSTTGPLYKTAFTYCLLILFCFLHNLGEMQV